MKNANTNRIRKPSALGKIHVYPQLLRRYFNNTTQTGLSVEFIKEENGIPINAPNWPWISITGASSPFFLRITRIQDTYVGYYSADGQQWQIVGSWTTAPTIADPQVGLFAQDDNTVVNFDYFQMTQGAETIVYLPLVQR